MEMQETNPLPNAVSTYHYPPVTKDLLDKIVERILSVGRPLQIILFGSQAHGDSHSDSTINIMVIEETNTDLKHKSLAYDEAIKDLYPDRNVLVHSLHDIEEWKYVPGHISTIALAQGKMLYEDTQRLQHLKALSGGARLVAEEVEYRTPGDLARYWFSLAKDDIDCARVLLDLNQNHRNTCFFAQQAVEKYLKGFLILHNQLIGKSHLLEELASQCQTIKDLPGLDQLNLKPLSEYALSARYGVGLTFVHDQAQEALNKALAVKEIILAAVPNQAKPGEGG